MKIFGFTHGGHDSSYAILIDGKITIHEELERINRQKETRDDVISYYLNTYGTLDEFDYIAYYPHGSGNSSLGDFNWFSQKFLDTWLENRNVEHGNQWSGTPKPHMKNKVIEVGHHTAHAANAFYASNFEEALIFSIDGGGSDRDENGNLYWSAFTIWVGRGNKIEQLHHENYPSMGIIWTDMLNEVFHLSSGGPPHGCQAGTVMGMAAYGDSTKFSDEDTQKILGYDRSPYHGLADDDKFHLAAKIQQVTEDYIVNKVKPYIEQHNIKNICFTGGVSLNCAMIGKMKSLLQVDNVFVPPVPYDAGLSMGVAQYVYHHILNHPRSSDFSYKSPYLGKEYTREQVLDSLNVKSNEVQFTEVNDELVCKLLEKQKIVSIFGGRSESGRRALGNRSILADPRQIEMKDIINEKTKHRQWFRPFAPSILKEYVTDWFVEDVDSPYMSFSVKFKDNKKDLVPAVVHKDGTGRLQTVTKEFNPRYHQLISTWKTLTGIPILLNTSFNDKEPIVETPTDALNCFLKTQIDYLYFTDYNILVSKNGDSLLSEMSSKKKTPKIVVAQFYTDNVKYGDLAKDINQKYCDEQGYTYVCETDTNKIKTELEGRAPTWYKPKFVLEVLEKHNPDYVLFLDIDAVVVDFTQTIETFISHTHDITFTQDFSGHSRMNAGVFLLKNTNWAKHFLKLWWDSADKFSQKDSLLFIPPKEHLEVVGYFKNSLWHDQTCLTILYDTREDVRELVNIITNRKLNWNQPFDNSFIFHAFAYGHLPYRMLDSVYTNIFKLPVDSLTLSSIGISYPTDRDQRHSFYSVYEPVFSSMRDIKSLVEIGVSDGNSLQVWKTYFPYATIVGVDKNTSTVSPTLSNIHLVNIDPSNADDLEAFADRTHDIDIIIDDASHKMRDQQIIFGKMFRSLKSGGVFIIEDLHTSVECRMPEKAWCNWGDINKTTTLDVLNGFIETGIIRSDYLTTEEAEYLQNNILSCEIKHGFTGSITSIIKKR